MLLLGNSIGCYCHFLQAIWKPVSQRERERERHAGVNNGQASDRAEPPFCLRRCTSFEGTIQRTCLRTCSPLVAAALSVLGAFNSLHRECDRYMVSLTVFCTRVRGGVGRSFSISQVSQQLLLTWVLQATVGSKARVPPSAAPVPRGFCIMPDIKGPIG